MTGFSSSKVTPEISNRMKKMFASARLLIKKLLFKAVGFLSTRPRLKSWAVIVADGLGIAARLRQIHQGMAFPQAGAEIRYEPAKLSQLTPRARQIYSELKSAIKRQQKEDG